MKHSLKFYPPSFTYPFNFGNFRPHWLFLALFLGLSAGSLSGQDKLGIFTEAIDVGPVNLEGSTEYDSETGAYILKGSGANIWFGKDEFQYAKKAISGDFILRARAKFRGEGVDPHRKMGWMVRTDLEEDAAMVAATVHGDGLAAIQFRREKGADVEEIKAPVEMPDIIQLERRGNSFFLGVARSGEPFWTVEVSDLVFPEDVMAGLFVCAHNPDVMEEARFDNVRTVIPPSPDYTPYRDYIGSHLEIMDIATGTRRIVHTVDNSIQAPNWTLDGKALIFNGSGLIYRFDIATGAVEEVPTDFVKNNNNDHVISFDGEMLGLSSVSGEEGQGSIVFTVPLEGGVPKRITPEGPSYLHGWSPDGQWLTFTGGRNGVYDIYKIPSDGSGEEVRLTHEETLDDGSEYSPDGKYIYFNSARTGSMELWRMTPDGNQQEQLTDDELQNWFPHIAPDNRSIVFLSYLPEVDAADHPFYKQVYLRSMPVDGGEPKVIAYLFGGQGTINVPSWSPDGKYIAFVSNSKVD